MSNENEKNEVVEEKDSKKSTEKMKKDNSKKKVIPFDKIDVTTATEDDIIQSGLRYHTKADFFGYMLMGVIVIFAFVPIILRIVVPKPITEIKREIVYLDLICYRTISREGHEISSKVTINYRDGNVEKTELVYSVYKSSQTASDDFVFAEINELNSIDEPGFSNSHEGNKYTYTADFKKNKALLSNEYLQHYSYFSGPEVEYLRSINYSCDSKTENKWELVRVDNNEKIKSLD